MFQQRHLLQQPHSKRFRQCSKHLNPRGKGYMILTVSTKAASPATRTDEQLGRTWGGGGTRPPPRIHNLSPSIAQPHLEYRAPFLFTSIRQDPQQP